MNIEQVLSPILLAIVSFFMVRLITKMDSTNDILNKFEVILARFGETLIHIEENQKRSQAQAEREILILRRKVHRMGNWFTVIRLKMENQGTKFHDGPWSLDDEDETG